MAAQAVSKRRVGRFGLPAGKAGTQRGAVVLVLHLALGDRLLLFTARADHRLGLSSLTHYTLAQLRRNGSASTTMYRCSTIGSSGNRCR